MQVQELCDQVKMDARLVAFEASDLTRWSLATTGSDTSLTLPLRKRNRKKGRDRLSQR